MARILIIDGDARDQERLASFLDRHEVVRSSGGADALQRLRDASDSVELAIMSWELEGIPSAPDLLVELRRRFLKIRVIVTSSLMDWSIAPRARTLGLNQATPDRTIGGEKTKLLLKSGVIESSQAITTDMQKGVSSEPVEDTEETSQRTPASPKDYTKEARRKQATHR